MASLFDKYDSDDESLDYIDFDDLDPTAPLTFRLHENENPEAIVDRGALKSYTAKEDGTAIYAEKVSDHSIHADRLVWVDGYESTTESGEHGREMTLVVLKLVVSSKDPSTKFQHFNATLILESKNKKTDHPVAVAWAPFHTPERSNETQAHLEITRKRDLAVKAGYLGTDVSGTLSRDKTVSWDWSDFDEGSSNAVFELKTGIKNGVTWFVKQNSLENKGVKQEVWVSALFARSSSDPYLVKFNLDVKAGTLQDLKDNAMKFFGGGDGKTRPYMVTPRKRQIANDEGEEILKSIDLNNLGKLRRATKLLVAWGPGSPHHDSGSSTAVPGLAMQGADKAHAAAASSDPSKEKANIRGAAASEAPKDLPQSIPVQLAGWYNPTGSLDQARLAALEGRVAQVEARLAAQDVTIWQLQQKLMAKDFQLS